MSPYTDPGAVIRDLENKTEKLNRVISEQAILLRKARALLVESHTSWATAPVWIKEIVDEGTADFPPPAGYPTKQDIRIRACLTLADLSNKLTAEIDRAA